MKSALLVLSVIVILFSAGLSFGDMYLEGVGGDHAMIATNDRFYVGADKAFIGAGLNLSGVGQASNGASATMISPQYFITAYHYSAGGTVTFYEGDTTASGGHTYTVDSSFSFTTTYNGSPSDVYLCRLTAPIPASDNITYYPVLNLPSYSDYVGMTIYNYGAPELSWHERDIERRPLCRGGREPDRHVLQL